MADIDKRRRSFMSRIAALLGGLAIFEAGWISATFLGPRRSRVSLEEGLGFQVAGPVERFEPGSVTAFRDGHFYLVRLDDGGFLALHRKCTHLGCTVPWIADEQRFTCPCHASAFDIRGDVLSAPAARALELFAVRIDNGIVKVDTNKLLRRASFESHQVTRV
ncbi:MAG: Rieske (2Fe-2S) protein [Gammaproteobacteria bacterium]|nr:Rieske (2Fe-2S) protein [Gammaproteobacteria bacterium]MDH3751735.1 Rieske (2Fe-2S) protein [Gammaproteobacteria bacterium]MDH3805839.1 Rieske (2Fe-2S) protein [Gammaproteobacteria bacterium]